MTTLPSPELRYVRRPCTHCVNGFTLDGTLCIWCQGDACVLGVERVSNPIRGLIIWLALAITVFLAAYLLAGFYGKKDAKNDSHIWIETPQAIAPSPAQAAPPQHNVELSRA